MDFAESDEMQMLREAVSSIASKFGHSYYAEKAHADEEPLHRALKQQRGVINDIHKHVQAVTKALEKRPS